MAANLLKSVFLKFLGCFFDIKFCILATGYQWFVCIWYTKGFYVIYNSFMTQIPIITFKMAADDHNWILTIKKKYILTSKLAHLFLNTTGVVCIWNTKWPSKDFYAIFNVLCSLDTNNSFQNGRQSLKIRVLNLFCEYFLNKY